jgi:hypothetical protein
VFEEKMLTKLCRTAVACASAAGISAMGQMPLAQGESQLNRHKVLIVGGGTAGTTLANQIHRKVRNACNE